MIKCTSSDLRNSRYYNCIRTACGVADCAPLYRRRCPLQYLQPAIPIDRRLNQRLLVLLPPRMFHHSFPQEIRHCFPRLCQALVLHRNFHHFSLQFILRILLRSSQRTAQFPTLLIIHHFIHQAPLQKSNLSFPLSVP